MGSIEPKLFAITYEYQDGGAHTIFSVEVDMDYETAELRVKADLAKHNIEDLANADILTWEQVPDVIDGHHISIEPMEKAGA